MLQIRNVPDEVHRKLKVRAAREGVTLSELLAREARRLVERMHAHWAMVLKAVSDCSVKQMV